MTSAFASSKSMCIGAEFDKFWKTNETGFYLQNFFFFISERLNSHRLMTMPRSAEMYRYNNKEKNLWSLSFLLHIVYMVSTKKFSFLNYVWIPLLHAQNCSILRVDCSALSISLHLLIFRDFSRSISQMKCFPASLLSTSLFSSSPSLFTHSSSFCTMFYKDLSQ